MKTIQLAAILLLLASFCSAQDSSRKVKHQVEPDYPEMAKRVGIKGAVRLQLVVAADGSVKQIKALGGSPVLISAAEDAVRKWRYEPGPESTVDVDFQFTPKN